MTCKGKQKRLHLAPGPVEAILLDIDKAIRIVRETAEEAEVVPNLMIGFGIDEIQAEYVAEIKLRHLNREYILKRTEEIDELEKDIAELEDVLKQPGRDRTESSWRSWLTVAKKYGQPRKSEILYEVADTDDGDEAEEIPDYPVHAVLSPGRAISRRSLPRACACPASRSSRTGMRSWPASRVRPTAVELLFFTNHHQVYKSRAADFCGRQSQRPGGLRCLPAWAWRKGEVPIYMAVTSDYAGHMLFFFQNGKCSQGPACQL